MTRLTVSLQGDAEIIVTRHFKAAPEKVYNAHITPALLQQWCLGPDGWTMPVCISEPRPGGRIRYEWTNGAAGFYLTGEYLVLEPFSRIVHVERMHLPDPTPDNRVETRFDPDGTGGTRMTMHMSLPSGEVREAMLATGMTDGMEASYVRMDAML